MRVLLCAPGSFLFCRADAFRQIGGFSTQLYAAEEVQLSLALRRWGRSKGIRFAILHSPRHVSSGRKFYLYSRREIAGFLARALFLTRSTLRDQKGLAIFYDGRR